MRQFVALADQRPLGRFRVEAEGHGITQLVSSHATLDEAVEEVCRILESGARLVGGARFVIVDDETGDTRDARASRGVTGRG